MTRTITTDPGAPPPVCSIHGTPMKSKGLYRARARWRCELAHKGEIHSDPLRPWCLKCRRPLKKSSNARASNWACSHCGACMVRRRQRRLPTRLKRPSRYQMQMPVEIIARPACLRCRREMWIKAAVSPTGRRHFLWLCGTCNGATVVARARRQYLPHIPSRPNCPRCSAPMYRGGKYGGRQNWLCLPCCIHTVRPEVYLSIQDPAGRPPCPRCSHTMRKDGTRHGRQCWLCPACKRTLSEKPPPVLHTPPQLDDAAALDLLTALSSQLPGNLSSEEREDARHDLLVAILEGSIGVTPTRREVSQVSHAARCLTGDRFKFVSLDTPIQGTNGLTRSELLIG